MNDSRPTVDAVIVYHESPETITRLLAALDRQDPPPRKIIVVDNASSAPVEDRADVRPGFQLIRLSENVGPSRARNIGLSKTTADLVLFVDDDLYPDDDCVARLVGAALETSADVVSPRIVLLPDGTHIQCDGASIHFSGTLILHRRGALQAETPADRGPRGGFVAGCLLTRREVLQNAGGFDEDIFFQFEDLELSYRLRALGHGFWCESAAVAMHAPGRGTPGLSFRGTGQYPLRRVYYTLLHRWMTILVHFQARTLLILAPALALYELAALAECARRRWLGAWWRAAASLVRAARSLRAKRQKWQARRRVPDREILVGGPLPHAAGFITDGGARRAADALDWCLNAYWKFAGQWL